MRSSGVAQKKNLNRVVNYFLTNKYVSAFLLVLVLIAVLLFAKRSLSGLTESDLSELSFCSLLLALGLITLAYLNRFIFWTVLTVSFQLKAPFLLAFRAFFYSLLGRYIPGKAGLFLFRIRAYEGGSRKKVGAALITEYIATLLAACILIIAGTMFIPDTNTLFTRYIPIGLFVVFVIFLHPAILKKTINSLFKLIRKEPLEVFPATKTLIAITSGYVFSGMLHGLALFLLLRVFSPLGLGMYPLVTGAYYMAAMVGVFAFFAPGGIGVREGVLFLLLSYVTDSQSVVIAAAIMRLLTLLSELILAGGSGFSYLMFRRKGNVDET